MLALMTAKAQDPHFSQFTANPVQLNPALTGFYNGDFRFTANYRSQWGSFTNAFRTFAGTAEFSMFKGKLQPDNFAVGLTFYNDVAGTAAFGTNMLAVSFGYKKTLGYNKKNSLALGVQAAMIGQSIDRQQLIFDNQYNGIEVDPNLLSGEDIKGATGLKPDVNVGLLYQTAPSDFFNLYIGAAYSHILQPKLALLTNASYQLEPKITGHAGAQIDLTRVVRLLPSAAYWWQGSAKELNVGSYVMFVMDDWNDAETALSLGFWARVANVTPDALIFSARLDFQRVTMGLSYDLNLSGLKLVTQSRGAYEVSLSYVGIFTTAGKRSLMIPCPVL